MSVLYTLHIWPSKWNLQSLDPTCLAAVMYLQLTMPGKFRVVPCTNPDMSPNGQLPFLTYAHNAIATFPSIVAFVSSLAKTADRPGVTNLDASLTSSQNAEKVALYAHVESCVADLVSHCFYGNDTNFWGLTNPTLAGEMPIPQKYYVPRRMRDRYRIRLEAAGLWNSTRALEELKGLAEKEKKKPDYKDTFTRAFEREKILGAAKDTLAVHASYVSGGQFYFGGDRPTSLDVYLAAHILLIALPPFPDTVLQTQLTELYPSLIAHARRIQAEATPTYEQSVATDSLLRSLVPFPFMNNRRTPQDPEDVRHRRKSLFFLATTMAMLALYCCRYALAIKGKSGDAESEQEAVAGVVDDEEDEE